MNTKNYYAHTLPSNPDTTHRHPLEDHLYGVAERSAEFVKGLGGDKAKKERWCSKDESSRSSGTFS